MNGKGLVFILAALLGGCSSSETASYLINGAETAITLVREKAYPWDDEYMRAVVVTSRPKCITRYKMPPDNGEIGKVDVYDADEGYYVLIDRAGQYMTNIADCSMFLVEKKIADPGERVGTFEMSLGEPPRFVPVPPKVKPKPPADAAGAPQPEGLAKP